MEGTYQPDIHEAVYPRDGGWTKDGGQDVLLLSIPEFGELPGRAVDAFDYAWLYDNSLKAYILCFRLQDGTERAILFQEEHAGKLLTDSPAYETFTVAISDQSLEVLCDDTPFLILPDIQLKRSLAAGW
jgi:hypothetical protein